MSFGFDRLAPPPRCERLENAPHFLRFRALTRSKSPQTIFASFMSPSPSVLFKGRLKLRVQIKHPFGFHEEQT
ncbi:hypothetical protein [Roseibium sp.]|uniref:hypothetical protein n=1 Tax=Roseibium sp. TaxID=1936156 RepID=UPI003BA84C26